MINRKESATTYLNPDGSRTVRSYLGPVNYQDESGAWKRIDTTIESDPSGGHRNAAGPVRFRFDDSTQPGHEPAAPSESAPPSGQSTGLHESAPATGQPVVPGESAPPSGQEGPSESAPATDQPVAPSESAPPSASVAPGESVDADDLVEIIGQGWRLGFYLQGASGGQRGQVEESKITYGDVLPGTDLRYDVGSDRLKELIVLKEAPADSQPQRFSFPLSLQGLRAEADEEGITFRTDTGEVVGRILHGIMWDSAKEPIEHPVKVTLDNSGDRPVVHVDGDGEYLAAPDRVFPVYADPTFVVGKTSGLNDAWVQQLNPTSINGQSSDNRIGFHSAYSTTRTFQWFDFAPVSGEAIVSATWNGYFRYSETQGSRTTYRLRPVAADWYWNGTTWNNQPAVRSEVISDTSMQGDWRAVDVTSWMANWASGAWPNHGIRLDADGLGQSHYKWIAAEELTDQTKRPYVEITYNAPPPAATAVAPLADATLLTQTPRLEVDPVEDDDGNQVYYWFRVFSGFETNAPGQVEDSGWITSESWTVPKMSLEDGVTYAWTVYTWDGIEQTGANWTYPFTIDLRLGAESSPTDSAGPVSADLATGNVSLSAASPRYRTVGGDIGLSFAYNSLGPFVRGLKGEYFEDVNQNRVFDEDPEFAGHTERLDTLLNFVWWADSPYPFIPPDNFLARWTGYVTIPTGAAYTGNWYFGALSDDGVRIWVNDTLVLDRWYDQQWNGANYGSPITLVGGQRVSIKVEYYDHLGDATVGLAMKGPNVPDDMIVPSDWLTAENPVLPDGWLLDAGAGELSYVAAHVNDQSVTLVGPSGRTFEYRRNGTGFVPPEGADGVLAADAASGNLVLHDADGVVYTFRPDGGLESAVSGADDRNPSAPEYVWSGTPPRVTEIRDRVSGRKLTLDYEGGNCPLPPAGGFDASPPPDMLCRVSSTWDGNQTQFFYAAKQLARIQNPGGEVTDFAYTGNQLIKVRDPLAADAVAAGVRTDDATVTTEISYDTASGQVTEVKLPAATAGATRLVRTYAYSSGSTTIDLPGIANNRVVQFDAAGRMNRDTSADGLAQSFEWSDWDTQLSSTDTAGRKSATIYDVEGRPTDAYGPAPAAWFGPDRRPQAAYTSQVPHSQTRYDEGITSLAATYWPNEFLRGPPKCHDTGVGHASGAISRDWAGGGPSCLAPTVDDWSGRYTGEVGLPKIGTYTFKVFADGGVRVWIDDSPVVDSWDDATGWKPDGTFENVELGATHRIRLEYTERTGNARLELHWMDPDGVSELVPGAVLSPGYGLQTSEITDDAQAGTLASSTVYDTPHLALASATTQDPSSEALTTRVAYEDPGSGYNRPISRTLPAGNKWTYTYYAPTYGITAETCGLPVGTNQGGLLKSRTGPDPDGTGPLPARVEEFVYDASARQAGVRVAGGAWSCATFDARSRVLTQTHPSLGGQPARTVTSNYGVGGNPLVASMSDAVGTITTRADLLARVVSYNDVWGQTTNYTYDEADRPVQTSGPAGTRESTFDASNGRPVSQKLDGAIVAVPSYSASGEVASVGYPTGGGNGTSLSSIDRDPSGRMTGLTWLQAGGLGTLASDQVTRSQSGRITDQTIDGVDPNLGSPNFLYDTAGRLTAARVPGRTLTYAYAPSGGCGLLTLAGKNTNRTSMTVNGGAATNYCYDDADRLTSTTDSRYSSIVYDTRGNTTTLGSEVMTYDGADRHMKTVKGSTSVTYARDATDRIVSRTVTGPATVAFRASSTADTGPLPATTLDIPKPSGVAEGDVMLLHVTIAGTASATTPAGWTLVRDNNNASVVRAVIYSKVAGASEPGSYTVTFSVPTVAAGGIGAYSGVDTASAVEASSSAVATDATSVSVPSVSATAGGRLVGLFALKGRPVTPPTQMTERWERSTPGATDALRFTSEEADETRSATGVTGTRQATSPTVSTWVGQLVALKPGTSTIVTRFGHSGGGESSDFTLDTSNQILERTIPLPGGVLLTKRSSGDVWSYPDIHGNVIATANASGAKDGATRNYDPFGEALGGVPDNSNGNFDYGWLGQHQRSVETEAGITTIEMGARPYVPGLGRFLEVDPVEGGSCNDYEYVCADSPNRSDLTGQWSFPRDPDYAHARRVGSSSRWYVWNRHRSNAIAGWCWWDMSGPNCIWGRVWYQNRTRTEYWGGWFWGAVGRVYTWRATVRVTQKQSAVVGCIFNAQGPTCNTPSTALWITYSDRITIYNYRFTHIYSCQRGCYFGPGGPQP